MSRATAKEIPKSGVNIPMPDVPPPRGCPGNPVDAVDELIAIARVRCAGTPDADRVEALQRTIAQWRRR